MAYLGLLDAAAPLFRPGQRVPGVGVLLALPSLIETGVFTAARQVYGSIGPCGGYVKIVTPRSLPCGCMVHDAPLLLYLVHLPPV